MIKRLSTEVFNEIYRQVPRLCVEVIINTSQGIILTKRLIPPCIGMWHFPGGTVYMGEKLKDTANRVAKEEIGIYINVKKMIGIIEYPELFNYAIGIAFLCELILDDASNGKQKFRGSFQAEEIDAFHIDKIPEDMIPEQKEFLENLILK